jgi:hypothetical protein
VFDRKPPGARPVYSTAASHWGCTLLIALLLSVWPQMRLPAVVDHWSGVIVRLAHAIDGAREVPACAQARPAREMTVGRRATDVRLART